MLLVLWSLASCEIYAAALASFDLLTLSRERAIVD